MEATLADDQRAATLHSPETSNETSRQVFEQLETQQYQLVLPAEFEELRGYLDNDGLLSDEEITKCLYDESLRQKDLAKLIEAKTPDADKAAQDKLTDYLWDVHQRVKGLPLTFIDPTQTYRIDVVDTGQTGQGQPPTDKPAVVPDRPLSALDVSPVTLHLDINGGFLANFLHNARLNHQQMNRFITDLEQQHDALKAQFTPAQQTKPDQETWSPDSTALRNSPVETSASATSQSLLQASGPSLTPWQRVRQTVSDWIAPTVQPELSVPRQGPPTADPPDMARQSNEPPEPPTLSPTPVGEGQAVSEPAMPYPTQTVSIANSPDNSPDQPNLTLTTAGVTMPSASTPIMNPQTQDVTMNETTTPGVPAPAPALMSTSDQLTGRPTRYQWPDVADQFGKLGITRQDLEKAGQLDDLLNGRKTGLLQLTQMGEGDRPFQVSGKLYIVNTPDNGPIIGIQPERKQLLLPNQFLGYELTDRDKQNLEKRGEMGKRVDLTDKVTGKTFAGYVGVDPDTKSLTVLRAERLRVPQTIKGITLTKPQQKNLEQGRAIKLEGMTGNNGQTFNAYVQVSAAKRSLTFAKIPDNAIRQTVDQKTAQDLTRPVHQLKGDGAGAGHRREKKAIKPKDDGKPTAIQPADAPKPAKQQKMAAPKPVLAETKPTKPKKQKGPSLG